MATNLDGIGVSILELEPVPKNGVSDRAGIDITLNIEYSLAVLILGITLHFLSGRLRVIGGIVVIRTVDGIGGDGLWRAF